VTGQVSSRRAGGVGGRRPSRIPGAKTQRSSLLAFRHPRHDSRSQVTQRRKRGSEASSVTVTDVGSGLAPSDSCASGTLEWTASRCSLVPCSYYSTSTMRMCDFTTAGPAESPYERYPLPALPTSWDGMHIHRMLPDLQQEQYQRLYLPRYTAPTSIVRLGSVV
jgi:hypothetical protein